MTDRTRCGGYPAGQTRWSVPSGPKEEEERLRQLGLSTRRSPKEGRKCGRCACTTVSGKRCANRTCGKYYPCCRMHYRCVPAGSSPIRRTSPSRSSPSRLATAAQRTSPSRVSPSRGSQRVSVERSPERPGKRLSPAEKQQFMKRILAANLAGAASREAMASTLAVTPTTQKSLGEVYARGAAEKPRRVGAARGSQRIERYQPEPFSRRSSSPKASPRRRNRS